MFLSNQHRQNKNSVLVHTSKKQAMVLRKNTDCFYYGVTMMKRLFLFAAYDKDGIVDDTLIHYLSELSKLGDIVFVMDNDASETELNKIKQIPHVLYAHAERHNEYDFGSYKRAYIWARDNKLLKKYDWIYLVNDSVLGPLFDTKPILKDLESREVDLTGMISYGEKYICEHIQSWFVGLSQRVATENFFEDFICSVKHENNKAVICAKYEFQLTNRIVHRGYKYSSFLDTEKYLTDRCHLMYHEPLLALKLGCPFIKKSVAQKVLNKEFLLQHIEDEKLLPILKKWSHRMPQIPEKKLLYKPVFRLRIFGLQIIKIYKVADTFGGAAESKYRIEAFGFLPVGFVHRTKHAK